MILADLWSKILFYKMFLICSKGIKFDFKTGNGIIPPTSRPLIKKLILQNVSHFYRGLQNWFLNQELELFKQEMELFLPLPVLWSKNSSNKNFLISTQELKIDFENWNRNQQEEESLSHFWASDQKTSFTKRFSFLPRSSKLIFKTGNGIV